VNGLELEGHAGTNLAVNLRTSMTGDSVDAPRKLYQRIAAKLAADIQKGVFAAGSRMPTERELAEAHRVSRPTIREAMIALEIRGWVEARQGSGLYVTSRDHGSAKEEALELDVGAFDVTEARVLFEGEAAALAAQSITEQQIAELDEAIRVLSDPLVSRPERLNADRRFHVTVAAATGNAAIRSVIDYLWSMRINSPLCVEIFDRAEKSGVDPRAEEHRAIANALKKHDGSAARDAMQSHLRGVVRDLLEFTESEALARTRSEIEARRVKLKRRLSL
jgi:DNA-binding FadR family transcriptional regulator